MLKIFTLSLSLIFTVVEAEDVPLVVLGNNPSEKLGRCEGDCDSNANCKAGYKCFQRNGSEKVPGCQTGGAGDLKGYDFCFGELPDLVYEGAQPDALLDRCEGNCANSFDCSDGLECFQRSASEEVPGCVSGGVGDVQGVNYCILPILVNKGNNPTELLGQCEGDCDSDKNCKVGYKCFQRSGYTEVPGCLGGGAGDKSSHDYCVEYDLRDLVYKGADHNNTKLDQCEGNCVNDNDCDVGAICYKRDANEQVPGCRSGGTGDVQGTNYCTLPSLVNKGDDPSGSDFPLLVCEGDCDRDSHCYPGLYCFQRNGDTEVPGCLSGGTGANPSTDYCVVGSPPTPAPTPLSYNQVEEPCLPAINFELMISGPCSYSKVISSVQQLLDYPDPMTHSDTPCPHSAIDEIFLHLPTGTTTAELIKLFNDICKEAQDDYFNKNHVPWSDVTLKGDKFDKEYYDGHGDWNEEHQSNYPHPPVIPGEPSNVLNQDAERVDDLYESVLQRYPLQWPGDSPTSMTNFANCELQSAMCCWVSDRQANDNNGNCATPYDKNCLDADPGDNTDLCGVDMKRSVKDATHVNDGFAKFSDDEEGPVHCHGFAWGQDESEADFRYRANNLFYVSMSDHLHDRGYVRNVQGAPMCACVENMPLVSRSDCTEISAKEFYKFTFPGNYTGDVKASLEHVDINFNACKAKQNNNLERFYERLYNEGRVDRHKYDKFRYTVVGDNQCTNAIDDLIFEKGYQHEAKKYEGWTMLYGRGSMISKDKNPELWKTVDTGSYIRRVCKSCSKTSHQDIIYKRLTSKGDIDFRNLFLSNWFSDSNVRDSDFKLFSNFEDAQNNANAWKFCNYNDAGIGFPRDCGPNGAVSNEWNSMNRGGETDFAFYLYTNN